MLSRNRSADQVPERTLTFMAKESPSTGTSEISRFSTRDPAYLRIGDLPTLQVPSDIFQHMTFGGTPTFRVPSD